jgi:RND family efflux transporter MFP subunit
MRGGSTLAVLALALLATGACADRAGNEEVEFRVPVTVREVTNGSFEDTVVATGTLRPVETTTLSVETGGNLSISKHPGTGRRLGQGDRVRAGWTIATITGEEVRLTARSRATRERYHAARQEAESMRALFAEGLVSEQELEQVEATLADAEVAWRQSAWTEEQSRLVAPIDGVLLELARDERGRPLADGQRVAQGFVLAEIAPLDPLIAELQLVGAEAPRIEEGQPVRVRHHASEGDRVHEGTVERMAPSLDPVSRAFVVEVEVDNDADRLRPGMFVEGTIVIASREEVPSVPRRAVTERGGRKVVFTVEGQRAREREVTLGFGDDEAVEIRSGLETGERIVVAGHETLTDDTPVRVAGS